MADLDIRLCFTERITRQSRGKYGPDELRPDDIAALDRRCRRLEKHLGLSSPDPILEPTYQSIYNRTMFIVGHVTARHAPRTLEYDRMPTGLVTLETVYRALSAFPSAPWPEDSTEQEDLIKAARFLANQSADRRVALPVFNELTWDLLASWTAALERFDRSRLPVVTMQPQRYGTPGPIGFAPRPPRMAYKATDSDTASISTTSSRSTVWEESRLQRFWRWSVDLLVPTWCCCGVFGSSAEKKRLLEDD